MGREGEGVYEEEVGSVRAGVCGRERGVGGVEV